MPGRPRSTYAMALSAAPAEPSEALAPAVPTPVELIELEPSSQPPQRSPARQHLADAIETVRALEAEIREAGAAVEPARSASFAARRALDDAEAALRESRPRDNYSPASSIQSAWVSPSIWGSQAETDEAARRARAAAEAPPISIADAKAAVEVAKDALDSARATLQWHEGKLRIAEERLHSSQYDIRRAVRLVLRDDPAVLALAMECRRLKTRAEAARQAFSQILWGDTVQPGSCFYGWDQVADARDGTPEAMADWSVSREWGAAIEALASDPDAPLPAA